MKHVRIERMRRETDMHPCAIERVHETGEFDASAKHKIRN